MSARVAVIAFPGSCDDRDALRAVELMGAEPVRVWHADSDLGGAAAVIVPGGFSYGDYLRPGALAALSPAMAAVRELAAAGGPVLGVCNGFQVLVETGLLPGALARNAHRRFECGSIHVTVRSEGPFTRGLVGRTLRLFIAHGEGRYVEPPGGLDARSIALAYTNEKGETVPEANPNGSSRSIAGVYGGPARNVLGLMPHPERTSEPIHGATDGRCFFESAIAALGDVGASAASLDR